MENISEFHSFTNGKKINPSPLQSENIPREIDDHIDSILKIYPDGINSIINEPEKPVNDIALILVLSGTEEFVNKFISKAQSKMSLDKDIRDDSQLRGQDNETKTRFGLSIVKPLQQQVDQQIYAKIKETKEIWTLLLEVFNELNTTYDKFVERILMKYSNNKSKSLQLKNPEYYSHCEKIISSYDIKCTNMFPDNKYYELNFEDFVLLFCSIIHSNTGIKVKLELRNVNSLKVMLLLYCNEVNYNVLAEFFGYELQLKPYAYKYKEYYLQKMVNDFDDDNKSITMSLKPLVTQSSQRNESEIQFDALNQNDCLLFPPYMPYEQAKDIKFRRYTPNDNYHECKVDLEFYQDSKEKCTYCSKYRTIDKLRLLYKSLTHLMPLSSLYKHGLISMLIYQKNYQAYDTKLQLSTLFSDTLRICCGQNYMKTLNTIRNYFGENISFYFLWVSFFFTWMIFPSIIGVIGSIIMVDPQNFIYEGQIDTFKNFTLDFYDISIIVFGFIITIWATLFLKAWIQYENLFRYFWGMENYEKNEPQSEYFEPDRTIPFILGESLKTVTSWKTQWRYMISYLVLGSMILIRCLIVFFLFQLCLKEHTTNFNELLLVAGLSSLICKIMSLIYDYVVYKITLWENHEKRSQLYNSQALKLMLFEFVNNYSGMFYIAFYKPYHETKCYLNNCLRELEYHLYILVFINFFLNYLVELVWYSLKKSFRMKKHHIDSRMSSQSRAHQMSCDKKNNLIKEYNRKLIDFGYVCLFSVSAPLAPLIILILTYFQNLFDIYKLFNLFRIEMIDGSSGIEIYYSKFKILSYLGMIINVCLVLFTSPKLVHLDEYLKTKITNNEDFIIKVIIFAILENVMLLIMKMVRYKDDMIWFQHVEDLKILYDKKYFSRDMKTLPHISLEEQTHEKDE